MLIMRLSMILTVDDLKRIEVDEGKGGTLIKADVHGLKCREAKRLINNIINVIRQAFHLIVIHGYNHGTAIKDMLAHSYENTHVVEKFIDCNNQGVTHLIVES